MATHTIFGGKVHVYKRENSRFWQCSTYLAGRAVAARRTTKTGSASVEEAIMRGSSFFRRRKRKGTTYC